MHTRPQTAYYQMLTGFDAAEIKLQGIFTRGSLILLFLLTCYCTDVFAQTQVFSDNFNRISFTAGAPTTYSITVTAGDGGANINSSSFLELTNDGSAAANLDGIVYVTGSIQDFSNPYSQILHSNTCPVEWTFNFRYNRTSNPSGLAASNYGTAIILACSNEIFAGTGAGNGYAVVYGSSGTPDPIRLVKFTGGLNGTVTTIISSGNSDISAVNNYVSVRVTYESSEDNWSLFIRDDGASGWADPSSGVTNQKGLTISDNTYTASSLTYFGFYWAYATAAAQTSQFDNFGVTLTSASAPTITISTSSLPSFGTVAAGNTSSSQSFTVAGINLTDNIVVTPPAGFEIRTGTNPFSSSPLSLPQTNGTVTETPLDVRFSPASAGSFTGNVTCVSTGATTRNIIVSGAGSSIGLELFVTSDTSRPDTNHAVLFPHAGMGTGTMYGIDDWTYRSPIMTFYIEPVGTSSIGVAEFDVTWDATKANLTVTNGTMFDFFAKQNIAAGKLRINAGAAPNLTVSPSTGKYIAKLEFTVTQPGLNQITITNADFRSFAGDTQQNIQVTAHAGTIKFYLGDFTSQTDGTPIGDGKINFSDLVKFALSYFSESDGDPSGYKAKFDIGPTGSSGSYFSMPNPDGCIQFEDLAIFSLGYGKTAMQQLLKTTEEPVLFCLQPFSQKTEGCIKVPLFISGDHMNVRAFSISMTYPSSLLEYSGFEKSGEMNFDYCFMAAKALSGAVTLDGAVMSPDNDGISKQGIIAYVIFKQRSLLKTYNIHLQSVIARDNLNHDISVLIDSKITAQSDIPSAFSLAQNYPNPFNSSTVISYQLSVDSRVQLKVYDVLGRVVAALVEAEQCAGNYRVEWNGKNMVQQEAPTGIYFCQLRAVNASLSSGDGSLSTRKMLLLR